MASSPFVSDARSSGRAAEPAAAAARDREWVARIRAGDIAAFEAMYRAYHADLGGYVQSLLRSREAAEETIQDLFLWLWEQRQWWEPAGALNAYLFRAARNRALSHLRHQRVEAKFRERTARAHGSEPLAAGPATPDVALRLREIEDALDRLVEALPHRCREVFRLNWYHRLSYAEVAQVLEISVKTVEMQMSRALAALRRGMAEWRE